MIGSGGFSGRPSFASRPSTMAAAGNPSSVAAATISRGAGRYYGRRRYGHGRSYPYYRSYSNYYPGYYYYPWRSYGWPYWSSYYYGYPWNWNTYVRDPYVYDLAYYQNKEQELSDEMIKEAKARLEDDKKKVLEKIEELEEEVRRLRKAAETAQENKSKEQGNTQSMVMEGEEFQKQRMTQLMQHQEELNLAASDLKALEEIERQIIGCKAGDMVPLGPDGHMADIVDLSEPHTTQAAAHEEVGGNSNNNSSKKGGLSGGAIAGIVIGSVLGFILLVVLIAYLNKTRIAKAIENNSSTYKRF